MSGGSRRLAAAQRTAAVSKTPSRKKRLGAWIIIVPALALFSFSVVAGATGFQPKPDVASAAAKVVPTGHDTSKPSDSDGQHGQSNDRKDDQDGDGRNGNGGDGHDDGGLVVIGSSHDDGGIAGRLGKHGREICWISASQLARVSAAYQTSTTTIRVHQTTYQLVTVRGADEHSLKTLLASAVRCELLQTHHLFFLPFDPNLS
jgi:hypothetical protein